MDSGQPGGGVDAGVSPGLAPGPTPGEAPRAEHSGKGLQDLIMSMATDRLTKNSTGEII